MFVEHLERRWLLISPELDLTFGRGGIAPLVDSGDFNLVRQLSDGKVIAAGATTSGQPLVARFNADGSPDATFDGDGVLKIATAGTGSGVDAAAGPDGKIVILRHGGTEGMRVFRFNADGTVDNTFGTGGVAAVGVNTIGRAIDVQPDGKIVVGHVRTDATFVTRLNVNGSVDTGFRGSAAALPRVMFYFDLAVAPDGKIAFVGDQRIDSFGQSFVGRLNSDGTIDTTFSGDGYQQVTDDAVGVVVEAGVSYPPRSRLGRIAVDPQGRPVVTSQLNTGRITRSIKVTRFTNAGARDASFGGGDGWEELEGTNGGFGKPVVFGPDGKIYAAVASDSYQLALYRINANGTMDASFGDNGRVTTQRETFEPDSLALDVDGNVLAAGQFSEPFFLAVARFTADSPEVHLNAEGMLFVNGTDGDDTVTLEQSGSNVILRRNGVATTYAASAVNHISLFGYAGDDTVTVPFALDAEFQGFDGDNSLTIGDGNVTMSAGDGDDSIIAGDGKHTISLGSGRNRVTVGSGADRIVTGAGNDTVTTVGGGDDFIDASWGDDSIITGSGNDTIYAGSGNDEVAAGLGDDTIQGIESAYESDPGPDDPNEPIIDPPRDGSEGRKLYFGEGGNDFIIGGSADSSLGGGDGNDRIFGNALLDRITAGAGNDTVEGGFGPDRINGGPGDDLIYGDYAFQHSENDGDDLLVGGDGNDSLYGQDGDDTLDGGAGTNLLDGGAGNNSGPPLRGVTLDNGLLAFAGTDANEQVSVWREEGGALVVWLNGSMQRFDGSLVTGIDLRGNGGHDLLKLHQNLKVRATLEGSTGNDELIGGASGDVMFGGPGDDVLLGQGGDDSLEGGRGSDVMRGGAGRDEVDYSTRAAGVVVGLDGFQDDGEANERDYAAPDVERVRGGRGNDRIGGADGLSLLYGNDGDDTLGGAGGADGLYGGAGNDRIDGGAGDDYVEGGAGDDLLFGVGGADALFGLGGNDRFFAASDGAADTVRGGPGTDSGDVDENLDDVLAVETLT